MTALLRRNTFAHLMDSIGGLRAYASRGLLAAGLLVVASHCGSSATILPPAYAGPVGDSEVVTHSGESATAGQGSAAVSTEAAGPEDLSEDDDPDDDAPGDDAALQTSSERVALVPLPPHPLSQRSQAQLQQAVREDPQSLGPMSVGAPNGGALFNAVQLPEDARWERVDPAHAWGTQETVDNLARAVGKVHAQFPDSLRLPIGHLSSRYGGHINPHRSHQAGTDVDIGFYYKPEAHRWYVRGTKDTLDLPRTWALVRAFITETDVRFILIDHSIQALLRDYASSIGEDERWLDDIFKGAGYTRPALIRHAKGHATHLHVRFYSPIAEETGRRCYPALISAGKIKPSASFVSYKAKKGDTLLSLAKRFGTTVKAIKRVNGLRSNTILAKRAYKIPSTSHTVHQARPVEIPARRLPPTSSGKAVAATNSPTPLEGEDVAGCDADDTDGDCE